MASLVQQAQHTVEMPSRSSATKWWIPVVQERTDATPFRSCSCSDKSQSREFRRRSRLHRFSSRQDGRCYCCAGSQVYVMERTAERSHSFSLYSKTMRSLSPDAQSRDLFALVFDCPFLPIDHAAPFGRLLLHVLQADRPLECPPPPPPQKAKCATVAT